MPMVRTVPVTAGSMSLKLPLRFGRCSPVRGVLEQHHATGAPRTCEAWSDSTPSQPVLSPDRATVQVTSPAPRPMPKTFEPMEFEFAGRKRSQACCVGQEGEDMRLLLGLSVDAGERWDPCSLEVAVDLPGPTLGCSSPGNSLANTTVVALSPVACRSGPSTFAEEATAFAQGPGTVLGSRPCTGSLLFSFPP